jgi:hypothetical protein
MRYNHRKKSFFHEKINVNYYFLKSNIWIKSNPIVIHWINFLANQIVSWKIEQTHTRFVKSVPLKTNFRNLFSSLEYL